MLGREQTFALQALFELEERRLQRAFALRLDAGDDDLVVATPLVEADLAANQHLVALAWFVARP